jgi:hypothetical protein
VLQSCPSATIRLPWATYAADLRCTTLQRETHSTDCSELLYPWHPWHGRHVLIHRSVNKAFPSDRVGIGNVHKNSIRRFRVGSQPAPRATLRGSFREEKPQQSTPTRSVCRNFVCNACAPTSDHSCSERQFRLLLAGERWCEILGGLPGYRSAASPGGVLLIEDSRARFCWWHYES